MVGRPSRRVRLIVAIVAALAILAPLVWLWQSSLVPSSYSVTGMGDHRDHNPVLYRDRCNTVEEHRQLWHRDADVFQEQ